MSSVLNIEHLSKSFGSLKVIEDFSLSVDKGDVIAVIGPSGSGKSTVLRCATMLERVGGGSISYGEDVMVKTVGGKVQYAEKDKLQNIRKKFGLVFQNFNLFPHFSVIRNITEAPVRVLGMQKEEAEETAQKLLQKMGLSDKADAYPSQLSGGQQQRVAIARALALNPEIMFFDEPTSALDPELTGEILKVMRAIAEENMTMVIVTHEMAFAHDVADKVLFMDKGVVIEQGTPKQVLENPQNERTIEFLQRFTN